MDALSFCTNGDVTASIQDHRGRLSIILPDGKCIPNLTFRSLMNELSAETPKYIRCRKIRYSVPETKAHMIYMSVKKAEKKKGYWTFQDGLTNESREDVEIDRCLRNYIQDLARRGYLVRISRGKYRTAKENDWSIRKNTTE